MYSPPKAMVQQQRTLGDAGQDPVTALAASLGTSPTKLLLYAAGGVAIVLLGKALMSGAKKARRKARRYRQSAGSALNHPVPIWQTLLLVGVAGGAVWYFSNRSAA